MDRITWLEALLLPAPERRIFLRRVLASTDREDGGSGGLLPRDPDLRRRAEELHRRTREAGAEILPARDALYPRPLLQLVDAPPLLFLRGRRQLLGADRPRIAVVGSRRGTTRGRRLAEDLGADLARAGVIVASGLALGVDGAAHRGALGAGGEVVGVIATGIDRVHPASHRDLHAQVASRGLLVSEQATGAPALPHRFVARNRILAGLVEAVVVVEAGARSGALTTVDFALQMGREVFCLPGPPDCPHSAGTLRLLREGATLVRHAGDVLESLGWASLQEARDAPLGLGRRPETAAAIAGRLQRPLAEILAALAELQLQGRVRREPGDRWRVTS